MMETSVTAFGLVELAFDADASKILALTNTAPRGVRELCEALGMPPAKCYRRVRDLEEIGLLKAIGNNKRDKTYSSNMERMSLTMDKGKMIVSTEFRDGGKNSFDLELDQSMSGHKSTSFE